MPDQTLTLSPHELFFAAPDTPVTAPAMRVEGVVENQKRDFLVRLEPFESGVERRDSYTAFLRVADQPDAPIVACHWQTAAAKNGRALKASLAQTWRRNSARSERVARLWHASGEPFGLSLTPDGIAEIIWRAQNGNAVESLTFRWRPFASRAPDHPLQNVDLRRWPQPELDAFCRSLSDDQSSILHAALRWQITPGAAKDAVAFGCDNGDWEQLRHYARLALVVVTHRLGALPVAAQNHSYRQLDFYFRPTGNLPCDVAVRWNNRLHDAICQIIRPSFWPDEPLFVYAWRGERTHANNGRRVSCDLPSQHEFLEAHLELRDWLRAHLSETEVEALLRPE